MPRVSERPLPPKTAKALLQNLKRSLKSLAKEEDAQAFLYDLFTPQEKEMFAKRLGIGILVQQKTHYRKICNLLKVTPTTVQKVKLSLSKSGRYQKFFEKMGQTKEAQNLSRLTNPTHSKGRE